MDTHNTMRINQDIYTHATHRRTHYMSHTEREREMLTPHTIRTLSQIHIDTHTMHNHHVPL